MRGSLTRLAHFIANLDPIYTGPYGPLPFGFAIFPYLARMTWRFPFDFDQWTRYIPEARRQFISAMLASPNTGIPLWDSIAPYSNAASLHTPTQIEIQRQQNLIALIRPAHGNRDNYFPARDVAFFAQGFPADHPVMRNRGFYLVHQFDPLDPNPQIINYQVFQDGAVLVYYEVYRHFFTQSYLVYPHAPIHIT